MIRVGIVIEDSTWLGGVNYYKNLSSALNLLPSCGIRITIFIGSGAAQSVIDALSHSEVVRSHAFNRRSMLAIARKGAKRILGGYDVGLAALLARHRIDVLSHAADWHWQPRVQTIGWIPDFQHHYLPSFFSQGELARRQATYLRIARRCDRVILSSRTAQNDFLRMAPSERERSRVLRFVPEIDFSAVRQPMAPLLGKYRIEGDYLFLPKQFWMHKNHSIVIDTLRILRDSGVFAKVIATGNATDTRNALHFQNLMAQVDTYGLQNNFRVLGVIPYRDMLGLMANAVATINPSLFEGWSSTVEESKIVGNRVLVSDIPVHREQDPEGAIFFDPQCARSVADSMRTALEQGRRANRSEDLQNAKYEAARLEFARNYESIVKELVGRR